MKKLIRHLRTYILRGILVSIPIGLSILVIRFFYVAIDQKVINYVDEIIGFRIPGLGFLLVLISLYLIGYMTSNIIGKRFLDVIERIFSRIPLIRTTYQVGKQLSSTLSLPENQVFKRVVLVDYFKPGVWSIGFVTGEILDKNTNEKLLKIFVPTAPNPTSGFLLMLKESQIKDPMWSIEDAMRMVISGGIIGPEAMGQNE